MAHDYTIIADINDSKATNVEAQNGRKLRSSGKRLEPRTVFRSINRLLILMVHGSWFMPHARRDLSPGPGSPAGEGGGWVVGGQA